MKMTTFSVTSSVIHRISILLVLIHLSYFAGKASSSDLVEELIALRSQTSGLIHLNDHLISRFMTSVKTPRPYHLIIFFDAHQLHDKAELHLPQLKREFSLLATSYIINNPFPLQDSSKPIFFCELEFQESKSTFTSFGINSLPHIRLVNHDVQNPKDSSNMDQNDLSRLANSMSDFIQTKTGIDVGPIHRPPPISITQLAFAALALLLLSPFLIKRILSGETPLHDSKTWLSGALFVYFFSVSGTMYNIIRGMPMVLPHRDNPSKVMYFYEGSGMQLGAEGFAVGSLYTVVGLVLAAIIHLVVKIRNTSTQRTIMVVGMVICFWAVRKVIFLDNWKTGYGIHAFLPSKWF